MDELDDYVTDFSVEENKILTSQYAKKDEVSKSLNKLSSELQVENDSGIGIWITNKDMDSTKLTILSKYFDSGWFHNWKETFNNNLKLCKKCYLCSKINTNFCSQKLHDINILYANTKPPWYNIITTKYGKNFGILIFAICNDCMKDSKWFGKFLQKYQFYDSGITYQDLR